MAGGASLVAQQDGRAVNVGDGDVQVSVVIIIAAGCSPGAQLKRAEPHILRDLAKFPVAQVLEELRVLMIVLVGEQPVNFRVELAIHPKDIPQPAVVVIQEERGHAQQGDGRLTNAGGIGHIGVNSLSSL